MFGGTESCMCTLFWPGSKMWYCCHEWVSSSHPLTVWYDSHSVEISGCLFLSPTCRPPLAFCCWAASSLRQTSRLAAAHVSQPCLKWHGSWPSLSSSTLLTASGGIPDVTSPPHLKSPTVFVSRSSLAARPSYVKAGPPRRFPEN